MTRHRGRARYRPGERIVRTGHWIGRRVNWNLGRAIASAGVSRYSRVIDRDLDHRAAAERGVPPMTSNARLALLMLALAMLVGFGRQLGVQVFEVLPGWVADTLTSVGSFLAVASVAFAVAAYRETPDPPPRSSNDW